MIGGFASGAAIGAGTGAVVGAFVLPAVGAIPGAIAGGIVGGIGGAWNASNDESFTDGLVSGILPGIIGGFAGPAALSTWASLGELPSLLGGTTPSLAWAGAGSGAVAIPVITGQHVAAGVATYAGSWLFLNSLNQMKEAIEKGQQPRGIERLDKGNSDHGELPHVHLSDGTSLFINGTWKHGVGHLTRRMVEWLQNWGWNI